MTENEAMDILKTDSCYECAQGADSAIECEYEACSVKNAVRMAIKALEEIQQYRALGTAEELKSMKEHGGFTGIELAEISAALVSLGEYCAIGTVEECRKAVEKAKKLDWGNDEVTDMENLEARR